MFHKIKKIIPQRIKNIFHLGKAIIANVCFGFPSRKIKIIGVTGTNGKTTTTQMIGKVLESNGNRVAVSSTINFRIANEEQVNKTKFTTLSAWEVQKFISQAVREKCQYVVLEVSSHALDQNRVWGIDFDVAVLTNISREHFDYHKNLENYAKAKRKLFEFLKEKRCWLHNFLNIEKKREKIFIVNLADEFSSDFLKHKADKKYGYSLENDEKRNEFGTEIKTIVAEKIQGNFFHSVFFVNGEKMEIKIPGEFNIENALASICVGLSQKINLSKIKKGLLKIEKIPGRMDMVENNLGLSIIIDYALTPDSMKKIGKIISDEAKKNESRFFWVFGSCGERDQGKRPMMGEIASCFADYIFLTNEDPYYEDPREIVDEIAKGIKNKELNENFWIIMNRKQAIKKALEKSRAGDFILITGKGAEETMAIKEKRVHWNDREVIENILRNLSKKIDKQKRK